MPSRMASARGRSLVLSTAFEGPCADSVNEFHRGWGSGLVVIATGEWQAQRVGDRNCDPATPCVKSVAGAKLLLVGVHVS